MPNPDSASVGSNTPVKRRDADATREKILDAALQSFSTQGFDASSTRQIESLAGVKRGLITYHFGSKQQLWEATADRLMRVVGGELQDALEGMANADGAARFRFFVRAYVRVCARHPELNRLMIREGVQADERLRWLVQRSVRPWFDRVSRLLDDAQALGFAPEMDHHNFFYILTGGAATIFANAAEARLLTGRDTLSEAEVSAHADVLANLLFPEK